MVSYDVRLSKVGLAEIRPLNPDRRLQCVPRIWELYRRTIPWITPICYHFDHFATTARRQEWPAAPRISFALIPSVVLLSPRHLVVQ